MSEEEAIIKSINGEVVSIEKLNDLYVVKVKGCSHLDVRAAKAWLVKSGFKSLAKKTVFVCLPT